MIFCLSLRGRVGSGDLLHENQLQLDLVVLLRGLKLVSRSQTPSWLSKWRLFLRGDEEGPEEGLVEQEFVHQGDRETDDSDRSYQEADLMEEVFNSDGDD